MLLKSFEELIIPAGVDVRIVIIENDSENFSENMVREHAGISRFPFSYHLEQKQGIVYARNRSVKEAGECDFCCFTDDDEIVTSGWLAELIKCQKEFNADGVAGPTRPSFVKAVPDYIEKFHQPDTYPYGTIVESAYTGCLMIRKKFLDMLDGPFDVRTNYSGGEDIFLTKQIIKLGGVIRFNPDAVAYEFIPENRSGIKYVIKRLYRTSNTRLFISSIFDENFNKNTALVRLVMRFINGCILVIPYLVFGKTDRLKGLTKIVRAVGGFAFIFGMKSKFYK